MFQLQNLFQTDAAERAHSIFSNLDLDGNGKITKEEFVKGCMETWWILFLEISQPLKKITLMIFEL